MNVDIGIAHVSIKEVSIACYRIAKGHRWYAKGPVMGGDVPRASNLFFLKKSL